MRIWMLNGQGGILTNIGWHSFARRLLGEGFDVSYGWTARRPELVIADIQAYIAQCKKNQLDPKIVLMGYSLGGNYSTYIAEHLATSNPETPIALVVAYDPTTAYTMWDLRGNVKRAISYHQYSKFGTSLFFGGAVMTAAAGGPKVEVTNVYSDHLLLQWNPWLHRRTIEALDAVLARSSVARAKGTIKNERTGNL